MKKISETEYRIDPQERIIVQNSKDILSGLPTLLLTTEYPNGENCSVEISYSALAKEIIVEGIKFTPYLQ